MSIGDGGDLERLLDQELHKAVGGLTGPNPMPAQAAYHLAATAGRSASLVSTIVAAASTKTAAGLAAAVLVAGGGTVAAASATGSTNPDVWGQAVRAAVTTCRAQLHPGEHGVGPCVSSFARQNGAEEKREHAASGARQNHPQGRAEESPRPRPSEPASGEHPDRPSPAGQPVTEHTDHPIHPTAPPAGPPAHR